MNTLPINFKKYISNRNTRTTLICILAVLLFFLVLFFISQLFNGPNSFLNGNISVAPTATAKPTPKPTPKPTKTPFPKKAIALTFDDGPKKGVTERILKTLKKHKAKATFFVLGQNAKNNKKLIKAEAKAGHEIAIHSYDHSNYGTLSNASIRSQTKRTATIIKQITGKKPKLLRTPYGIYSERVSRAANMPIILWNVDTLDWDRRTTALKPLTVRSATRNARHGNIVLMHDIHSTTADVLNEILTKLSKKGFKFVTVSDMIQGMNKKKSPAAKNKVYFSGKESRTLYKLKKK